MLNPTSNCPAAAEELEKIFSTDYVKQLNRNNQDLIEYVKQCSGNELHLFNESTLIYDILKAESNSNLKLPEWVTDRPEILRRLKELDRIYFKLLSSTRKMQRLRSGVLLNDISNEIERFIKNLDTNKMKKLFLYLTVSTLKIMIIIEIAY